MGRISKYISTFIAVVSLSNVGAFADVIPVMVIKGDFGALGRARKLDITKSMQEYCNGSGESCSVFCSETSFGQWRLGRRPICRVIYRCPDGNTRSAEAAREELIMLRCDSDPGEAPPLDTIEPPRYQPPGR